MPASRMTEAEPRAGAVSVIVPTLNEAENVEPLVRQVFAALPHCAEIIIVDDGSNDGTRERVPALAGSGRVRLLARDHPTLGLSGAVIAGARAARGEIVIVMDADLSHPPGSDPAPRPAAPRRRRRHGHR